MSEHADDINADATIKTAKKKPVERHLIPEIKMPSDAIWKQEFKAFELTVSQENELKIAILQIEKDINDYNNLMRKIGARAELKRKLLAFEKSLAIMRHYIDCFEPGMDHWMPSDALEQIGLFSNFWKAEAIHGGKTYSARINQEMQNASFNGSPLSIEEIGEKLEVSLRSLGLLSGPRILKRFIQEIHDPLRKWVEIERSNKGGAPAQKTVRHVIYWLAWSAPEIIGSEAAVSKDGPFVRLCSAVLRACGRPNDGVGGIAPEIVKKALADKKKHQEEMEGKSVALYAVL
jgi:hypothetical protein